MRTLCFSTKSRKIISTNLFNVFRIYLVFMLALVYLCIRSQRHNLKSSRMKWCEATRENLMFPCQSTKTVRQKDEIEWEIDTDIEFWEEDIVKVVCDSDGMNKK